MGVAVGPSPSSAQVSGGGWGEVLGLVQTPLFIGCEVAGRAQHSAGCNARQLGTQEVGLCTWEGWVGRHLQDPPQTWSHMLDAKGCHEPHCQRSMLASTELRLQCYPDVSISREALLTPGVLQKHQLLGMSFCTLGWEHRCTAVVAEMCELSEASKASGVRGRVLTAL